MHRPEFSCICSWKTGTVIIFVLSLVALIITIVVNSWSSAVSGSELQPLNLTVVLITGVFIMITASGLFGVFAQRPRWMIPFMTIQLLGLVGGAIAVMVGPALINIILYTFAIEDIKNIIKFPAILIVEILLMIWTGVNYYFLAIVLNCYKQLRAKSPR